MKSTAEGAPRNWCDLANVASSIVVRIGTTLLENICNEVKLLKLLVTAHGSMPAAMACVILYVSTVYLCRL